VKRILKYLKGYVSDTILAPLFKLCEAALELIVPLIIASVIDIGIEKGDTGYILGRFFILILLGALGLIFSVTAQYFAARASCGFVGKLRLALFSHIESLSYKELDRAGTSTLITRMSADANSVQTGLNLALRLLLRSPFVVFGAMVMAFTIDTKSAMTFVWVIPLLAAVVYGIMLISMPMHKKRQICLDGIVKSTRNNLEGVRVIRAFAREDEECEEFTNKSRALERAERRVGKISALLNPLTFIIINLAIVCLIYSGAIKVDAGDLTTGQLVALYNYMSQILVELIKLANLIVSISKAAASASRISSVFDLKSEDAGGELMLTQESDLTIRFTDVGLSYNALAEKSLSGISFMAKRGDTVGIIGATGSGKSSLINLIPAFYEASEGEILIGGENIKSYNKASLREKIGMVSQRTALFSGSIRENLTLKNKNVSDDELYFALRIAEAEKTVRDKGGLDAQISEGGKNLSGGQRQRLTIARALVGKPEILILDDATSALDYKTELAVRENIKKYCRGMTVFIVSQRTSSIMDADLILVLEDGELCGMGKHNELLLSCDVYREIHSSQFGGEPI
jgi:ABC-type multidrug transport system fused ATPase/permease subunit